MSVLVGHAPQLPPAAAAMLPNHGELLKPRVDELQYRFLTLSNKLHVLVISDPSADKAAASMDVGVGSLLDPQEFQGLAHFTEHMLFYSSKKYPVEDAYSKFVSDHGGHTNAFTASENTNYSFDINWEHLAPALDRFSQFFISPLISKDGVDREINAVDSEHGKNLQADAWRHMQLAKHTANPAHPWARFATGNLDTLKVTPESKGLDVRQAVVDFHDRHYSANLMRLCVLGRQPLDELQQLVTECFTPVPNSDLPVPTFSSDLFLPSHYQQLLKLVPVKDAHACEWAWQVPPSTPLYRKSPLSYLSHLLGHEGDGSIFALLKKRGWVNSLVAGESGLSISCTSFFYVRVDLTNEGHQHVADIGAIIFSYLGLIAREGIQRGIWEEVAALSRLGFDFADKQAPYSYTTSLSGAMQLYPDADLLLALYHVPQEWDPDCVRLALGEMSIDKVRMSWTSKLHADVATQEEPWYGTKYSQQRIPDEWVQQWRAAEQDTDLQAGQLHLPAPNPFVPTDLALRSDAAPGPDAPPGPQLIMEEPGSLRLWHRCELKFSTPKAVLYADFQCPEAYASPYSAVATRLLIKLVEDALSEISYPATLAGLHYDLSATQYGFQIQLSGYSHKLPKLLEFILDKLIQLEVAEDRFAVKVEKLVKDYANFRFGQPYSWAMYRRELLLNMRRWSVEEYEQVLPRLTRETVQAFKTTLLRQCFVNCMLVGNVSAGEAKEVGALLLDRVQVKLGALPVFPSQMRDLRVAKLPAGCLTLLEEPGPDPANINSAVSVMFQVGPDEPSLLRQALLELLVHMSKREAFNILRTQQQLGYIVHLFKNHELGVSHLEVLVQSSVYSATVLADRVNGLVDHLLAEVLPVKCGLKAPETKADNAPDGEGNKDEASKVEEAPVQGPSDAEFHKAVSELAKTLSEKPKRLGELARTWWSEIFMDTLLFNRQERLVEVVQSLQPQQLVDFYHAVLVDPASSRKALIAVSASTGAAAGAAGETSITDSAKLPLVKVTGLPEFKQGCEVWPSVAGVFKRSGHVAAPGNLAAAVKPAAPVDQEPVPAKL